MPLRLVFERIFAWCFGAVLCATPMSVAFAQATPLPFPVQTVTVNSDPLDLNTASAAQLRALPGMGDAYVQRVLDGRPYTAKNQLVTRGILPQSAYDRIRDFIVAHHPQKL